MQKKGQAAMEFLMTYGWAILAAVIAIGVLGYFGVFSPGKYTSGNAIITSPFYVNAHNAKVGGITLELSNRGGETFEIQRVGVLGTDCSANFTSVPANVSADATIIALVPCTLTVGNTVKGDIIVEYTKSGSNVTLTATGTVAAKVV